MTPEQQRIAIAEHLGWKDVGTFACHSKYGYKDGDKHMSEIPDYTTDLNAMHEAEKKLIFSKRLKFGSELRKVCSVGLHGGLRVVIEECISATAAQRAEAFLRTIGKWTETPQNKI